MTQTSTPPKSSLIGRIIMLGLHSEWVIFNGIVSWLLEELRTTWLGGALLIAVIAATALIAVSEVLRQKNKRIPGDSGRPPRFTLHVLAGLVIIAAASFGIFSCFLLDLPNDALFHLGPHGAAPVSRWIFLLVGVFGFSLFYGCLTVAAASGLLARRPPSVPAAA